MNQKHQTAARLLGLGMILSMGAIGTASATEVAATVLYTPAVFGTNQNEIFYYTSTPPRYELDEVVARGFDPSLGTLTSMTISMSGTETLSVTALNGTSQTIGFLNIGGSGTLTLRTLDPNVDTGPFNETASLSVPTYGVLVPGATQFDVAPFPTATAISASETVTNPSLLSQYIGASKLYDIWLFNNSVASGCDLPLFCTTSVTGSVDVNVTYGYTAAGDGIPPGIAAVPEPASALLFGAGLCCIGALLRRRRTTLAPLS